MKKSFTAKLWKVMRICAVQAVIAITLCGVTLAHPNYAQVLDREISITIIDLPFEKALNEIEQVAKVKFGYSINQFQDEPNVSLSIEKKTLRDVLDELLAPRKIRYKVHEKEAAITLKKITVESEKDQSSIHDGSNGSAQHQALIHVTGTVTEASTRTPMAGVNVIVKGTTNGTTTDAAGRYNLGAEENDVLIFSFIGYASLEIPVNGRTVIDVVMTEDVLSLGEVVVNAGYWEVKDQERTGNIARVTSEEIQRQPVSNPLQALQGRMAGVYIQQNSGMPGGALKIQIRGQNSLRDGSDGKPNGNLPLYVIDGVPFISSSLNSPAISGGIAGGNPLSAINPNDIESIEVLKDADATSIYGSRGANGVVLITTKRGNAGKPKLDIDMYQGVGQVSHFVDLLDTKQYIRMRKEGFQNDMVEPDQFKAPDLIVWDTTRYTNWQKKLIGGSANISNVNLSFTGGNSNTKFLLAGGYYREGTVFPGNNTFHRSSGRLFIDHKSVDNRFFIEASTNYSISQSDIPSTDFTSLAVSLSPNAPRLYDASGNLNWENSTWTNPLAVLRRKYYNTTDNLIANATIGYEVIKNLRVKSSFGYTSMTVDEIGTNPISSFDPQYASFLEGYSNFGDGKVQTWIVEPVIDYNVSIGKGLFTFLAGGTFQQSMQENKSIEAYGYANDALLENLGAASTILVTSNDASVYKYSAAFARVNYNLNEKYILNLTARRDGSSRFGPGNQFANFGAVGAAWIFSREPFMKNVSFLSFGKLRASYGSTGSDAIGNYQYLEAFSTTRYPYGGSGGLALNRLANPAYSWETNNKAEIGLELAMFDNRVTFSSSYYLNRSSGQLVGLPLPIMTGQSSVQFNLPATVQNSGLELLFSSTNIKKTKFEWTTTFNITIPRNKLLEFPDLQKFPAYISRYDVGKSVYTYKAYQYNGVNPETGLYQIADRNNDGQYSGPADYIGLKQNTQSLFGGISNSIRYRGFQLELFFQFVKQNGFSYRQSFAYPGSLSNQPDVVMNRWQQAGDASGIQRFSATDPAGEVGLAYYYQLASDHNILDATFIRLKNASLSWRLPSSLLSKATVKDVRIFLQGQNLFTITDYVGLDPETQTSLALPPLRIVSVGFHLTL